jgi:hypothetical protein
MMPGEDEQVSEYQLAGETDRYRSYLIEQLIELTLFSEHVGVNMLTGRTENDQTYAFISKLINVMAHILPKVEGGGESLKDLKEQFEFFKPLLHDPSLPAKEPSKYGDRIPDLYYLIITTFERLGLKSI